MNLPTLKCLFELGGLNGSRISAVDNPYFMNQDEDEKSRAMRDILSKQETVKKSGKSWNVYNKAGTKKLGSHPSRKKALAQLSAIEINKHK